MEGHDPWQLAAYESYPPIASPLPRSPMSTMHYIYGPIPSRRLGRSLGVDPIPLKTCNWNCIYCQLGRSTPLTNERREYAPRGEILAELETVLSHHVPSEIDFISFVGSGEPTLHSGLGWLVHQVKARTAIPVAVITNGSLLYLPEVRTALLPADVVMPTLSAGTAAVYRHIHRPHPDVTFERLVTGITAFRAEYQGRLWIEVMLLQGVNDSEAELRAWPQCSRRCGPTRCTWSRPIGPRPNPGWVHPTADGLMRAEAILGPIAHVVHPYTHAMAVSDYATPQEAILGIITRHPMSQVQLTQALHLWEPDAVAAALADLVARGEADAVERLGVRFWVAAAARFAVTGDG